MHFYWYEQRFVLLFLLALQHFLVNMKTARNFFFLNSKREEKFRKIIENIKTSIKLYIVEKEKENIKWCKNLSN